MLLHAKRRQLTATRAVTTELERALKACKERSESGGEKPQNRAPTAAEIARARQLGDILGKPWTEWGPGTHGN